MPDADLCDALARRSSTTSMAAKARCRLSRPGRSQQGKVRGSLFCDTWVASYALARLSTDETAIDPVSWERDSGGHRRRCDSIRT